MALISSQNEPSRSGSDGSRGVGRVYAYYTIHAGPEELFLCVSFDILIFLLFRVLNASQGCEFDRLRVWRSSLEKFYIESS